MRTLNRYLLREVGAAWAAVTSVLLVVLVANQLASVLGTAAAYGYPRAAVFGLIWLTTVQNLTVIVLDNGIYEVTGGQKTAATVAGTDFAGLARAAGFPSIAAFDDLATWQQQAVTALALPGPRFISLAIEPVGPAYHLEAPGPMKERVSKFMAALAGNSE